VGDVVHDDDLEVGRGQLAQRALAAATGVGAFGLVTIAMHSSSRVPYVRRLRTLFCSSYEALCLNPRSGAADEVNLIVVLGAPRTRTTNNDAAFPLRGAGAIQASDSFQAAQLLAVANTAYPRRAPRPSANGGLDEPAIPHFSAAPVCSARTR
jgi:hypothetical protein